MNSIFFKTLSYVAALCFAASLVIYLFNLSFSLPLFLVAGLISTAIAFNGYPKLKGFSYTIWILVGISLGMFYSSSFVLVGDFQLKRLIVPFVQVTMLGMGAQMSFDDFKGVVKMPKGVITGVLCHFTIMPLVGFALSKLFHFSPEIAAGVVLIGCVPSAMASNVMSFLAKANLALAVTIGAVGTLLSPFLTPLLMRMLGGEYIQINVLGMMIEIINMIIVPIVAGFIFNLFYNNKNSLKSKTIQLYSFAAIILITNIVLHFSTNATIIDSWKVWATSMAWFYIAPMLIAIFLKRMKNITIDMISSSLAFVAMLGIVINTIIITAAGRDSLMQVGGLLILSCLIHNMIGFTIGYGSATLMGLPEKDRRTIAFEVGMQNGGVATGLALQMGKIATVGLASAIFGPLQNLTGSTLVYIFKKRSVKENKSEIIIDTVKIK
ncbi:MAG: bile acid:sodium symporter family protein [Bacteroidales bacterium]